MTEKRWALHTEPHRHYKHLGDNGKWSWNAGGRRIAGVTSVLDGGQDALTNWAVATTLQAAQEAHDAWYGEDRESALTFAQMVSSGGRTPNDVRNAKAALGTGLHEYLAQRLCGTKAKPAAWVCAQGGCAVPYGLRAGVEAFLADFRPEPVVDAEGPRVERCVGDAERALGGTYDAQVRMGWPGWARHRLDLKSSNTVQPKHFAQVSEYEHCAQLCGEEPSDYLTLVHVNACGDYALHSIQVDGADWKLARAVFEAHLTLYRGTPKLAELLKVAAE